MVAERSSRAIQRTRKIKRAVVLKHGSGALDSAGIHGTSDAIAPKQSLDSDETGHPQARPAVQQDN